MKLSVAVPSKLVAALCFSHVTVEAGMFGYALCATACFVACNSATAACVAASGGVATPACIAADAECCGACVTGCAAGLVACFDETTTYAVSSKDENSIETTLLHELTPGDYVLTLDDTNTSRLAWTKVVDVKLHASTQGYDFVHIFTSEADLRVTNDHIVIIDEMASASVATQACEIGKEDAMHAIDTTGEIDKGTAEVVNIEPYRASTKVELVTESGTVLAFGADGKHGEL
mmetsp:Transcript_68244/g.189491  ORF Transcript_68244/g.189491 Transcript_68244/m.189491 type:complete len:233 (+) Transcript_68244:2322-3020(+)